MQVIKRVSTVVGGSGQESVELTLDRMEDTEGDDRTFTISAATARQLWSLIGMALNMAKWVEEHKPTAEEMNIAERLGKIEAIKTYRDRTGAGLKEAKDAIEEAMTELGVVPPPPKLDADFDF